MSRVTHGLLDPYLYLYPHKTVPTLTGMGTASFWYSDALRSLYAWANKKTTNNATKGLYMYGS